MAESETTNHIGSSRAVVEDHGSQIASGSGSASTSKSSDQSPPHTPGKLIRSTTPPALASDNLKRRAKGSSSPSPKSQASKVDHDETETGDADSHSGSERDLTAGSTSDGDDLSINTSISGRSSYRPAFLPGHMVKKFAKRRQKNRRRRGGGGNNDDEDDDEDEQAEIEAEEEETEQIDSYRRLPILSGALAPFSIMLEVPGLTTKWYVRNGPEGMPVQYRNNPVVLDVGLAFSIAAAVAANVMLILRFTKIVRPRKATLVATIGFVIHDAINTAALIAFGVIHAIDDGYTYSQAYWMTLAATTASFACTIGLIFDFINTQDFGRSGSGLTAKQSQLVIAMMLLLIYMSIGALIWSLLLDLDFQTGLYFTVVTILTVGFGDILPTTTGSRIFLFFFSPPGIVLFAATVYIARGTILEEFENSYQRRREAFSERLRARRQVMKNYRAEKRRLRLLRKKEKATGQSDARPLVPSGRRGHNDQLRTRAGRGAGHAKRSLGWLSSIFSHHGADDEQSSQKSDLENSATSNYDQGSESPVTNQSEKVHPAGAPLSSGDGVMHTQANDSDISTSFAEQINIMEADLSRQRQDLEDGWRRYREDLERKEKSAWWAKLTCSFFIFASWWVLGAGVFSQTEGWTFFEGFYFTYVLATTIGFGDYAPRSEAGRTFFIVYALVGVGVLTILISVFSDAWNSVMTEKLEKTQEKLRQKGRNAREALINRKFRRKTQRRSEAASGAQGEYSAGTNEGDNAWRTTLGNPMNGSSGGGGILRQPREEQHEREKQDALDLTRQSTRQVTLLAPALNSATDQSSPESSNYAGAAKSKDTIDSPVPQSTDEPLPDHTRESLDSLPMHLAKSSLALRNHALHYINSRRDHFSAFLRKTSPALREQLPAHLGGQMASDEWDLLPHERVVQVLDGLSREGHAQAAAEGNSGSSVQHSHKHRKGHSEEDVAEHAHMSESVRCANEMRSFLLVERHTRDVIRHIGHFRDSMQGKDELIDQLRQQAAQHDEDNA